MKKLWEKSPFFHSRGSYPLDMIVVHHIGSKNEKLYSVGGTITWFTNEEVHRNKETGKIENKVSAHYIIPRLPYKDHDIIYLVKESDIAYHAGYSQWVINGKQRKYINNYSVGIELEGDGNLCEYTDFQYEILKEICKELMDSFDIPEENIVGHEDISPGRKVDPGKMFDWKRLRQSISPVVITMPDIHISPSDPAPDTSDKKVPDEEFSMGSGENSHGEKEEKNKNLFKLIIEFILKIFK